MSIEDAYLHEDLLSLFRGYANTWNFTLSRKCVFRVTSRLSNMFTCWTLPSQQQRGPYVASLRNYQREDCVEIPEVLQDFMGGKTFLPFLKTPTKEAKGKQPNKASWRALRHIKDWIFSPMPWRRWCSLKVIWCLPIECFTTRSYCSDYATFLIDLTI